MKKMRMSLMGLLAAIVIFGSGMTQDAKAQVAIDATFQTPDFDIRVGNTRSRYHRNATISPIRFHRITKMDRQIARRLGRYTGVSTQKLLQLKRRGYRWFEIGQWLRLPARTVRAAMHNASWKRFMKRQRHDRCIIEPYEVEGRVSYYQQLDRFDH